MGSREGVCVCSHCQQTTAHLQGTGQTTASFTALHRTGQLSAGHSACRALAGNMCSASGAHGFLPFSLA